MLITPDHAVPHDCTQVNPKTVTLNALKTAAIRASNLEYTPSQVIMHPYILALSAAQDHHSLCTTMPIAPGQHTRVPLLLPELSAF